MAEQLLTEGDVIKVNKLELECVHVSWRDRDGGRENYAYTFRPKSEMDEERENQRKVDEAAKEQTNKEEPRE